MGRNLIGYLRVSTEQQSKSGLESRHRSMH